ncbi:hypothetical protein ACFV5G_20060 [Streptomyces sp. NPDC059766]|uniref:hypothetical protein n=1 Tax=Streptomyces sp. NPDC059766 TaxID=3346940 RepID=UPI00365AC00A
MDSGAIRRRLALGTAVLAASGLLALASPASAEAAPAQCAGRMVKVLPFATGTVQVFKRNGYVCAVTLAGHPGRRTAMSVSVQARGNRPVVDSGQFTLRAGPVTVHAGHRCVRVRGSVGAQSIGTGWILC